MSLKHGGDTRPWVSMFRRAESVEASYEALVKVLTDKDRLELIAPVNRQMNREVMDLTHGIADVFKSLEKINEPILNLVVPSYYLLMRNFVPAARDSVTIRSFRRNLRKYMDDKFWTSIVALHWMATFLDPSFKHLEFLPQASSTDTRFKRNLQSDLDSWIMADLETVIDKLERRNAVPEL